ncbi:MAG: cysteine desulfurase [Eubacterium sp.]|nr:cysteine desulfurase [Eubacterium sp.]
MEVYFDNSATTKVYPEVRDIMLKVMDEDYGNPSSLHLKGVQAEHYIKDSADIISKVLKCMPDEIIFTSGGTESNNLAIIGTALAKKRKGKHLITSSIEHASVLSVMAFLEKEGFEVTYISPDSEGRVRAEDFAEAVREDTILVSCMHINNEIGAVQPIAEIAKAVKKKNPDVYVHTDCIQSFGKIEVNPKKLGVDMLSVSGHKLHGPKGSGFLYVKKGTLIRPIIYGGGQQKNMRSGTENVPAIAGLGTAVKLTMTDMNEKMEKVMALRDKLIEGLTALPEVYSNSETAPHIASISFTGVRAEVMLHALEDKGIYVSSGSACSSNKRRESAVLTAIGLDRDRLESTLRFSFNETNTEEEVDYAVKTIAELLPVLRHYVRG